MKKALGAIAIIAATVASASVAQAGSASAATNAVPRAVKVVIPMHITGFDAAVARAHGYVIRTGPGGRQYSVKAAACC